MLFVFSFPGETTFVVSHMPSKLFKQLYRPIQKNSHFDGKSFIKDVSIHLLTYTPIGFFGFFRLNDSIHEAAYLAGSLAIAIVASKIVDGFYDMGMAWSTGVFFAFCLVSFIVAIFVHPFLFGEPLFPT